MQSHTVTGGGGIDLRVDETGRGDGRPVLFIHGYAQSRRSWDRQVHPDLADEHRSVAMDDRGHGDSGKPRDAYDDSSLWTEDVQSVIETLDLDRPVLVGWSYGGLIISDDLAEYGTEHVSGLNYVGTIWKLGTDALAVIGEDVTELVPGFESTGAEERVETLDTVIGRCVHGDLDPRDRYYLLGFNAAVPSYVREGLHSRTVTYDGDLRAIDVPTLITHGEEDIVVLPGAAEEHDDLIDTAETSRYPGTGHSPFWEAPERFNRELRGFVEGL